MNKANSRAALWNRQYTLTVIINMVIAFSFYMVASIMSKHLVNIGIDIAAAGVIVGLFSITSLCCRPLSGLLADRMSSITLLQISNILMAAGLAGFAFVRSMPALVIFRIINGAGFALLGTSVITLATQSVPQERRGEGIGYLGLGMALASAVAPGFGIMIAEAFGMRTTFLIAAGLCAAAIVMLRFLKEEKKERRAAKRFSFGDLLAAEALPFTLIAGTFSFVNGIIASYLVLFADELGIAGISSYFTLCAVCLMIVRPLSGKLMDRKGMALVVIPGMILTTSSMFLLGISRSLPVILLTGILRSLGQGSAQPSLQVGCISRCGQGRSGVATSTYYLGGDVFQGTAPMIGGVLIGRSAGLEGYRLMFWMCGVLMAAALLWYIGIEWKNRKSLL